MKASLWFASSLLAVAAFGQPVPGQPPGFTCVANAGNPVIVRTEGITELVGDLLLQCTGGAPTPAGLPVPKVNLMFTLNTAITSRQLPNGSSEALLLIDEPGVGANASVPQLGCLTPGQCNLFGNGTGVGQYNGKAGYPNIYQARQVGANAVEWDGIPIDPPGTTGVRLVRMTNVRANATQLGLSATLVPTQIVGFVSTPGSNFLTINNPQQTLATVQPGLAVGVDSGSFQYCPGFNGNQLFSELVPGVPGAAIFTPRFQTGFPGALKPQRASNQSTPGAIYNSESNFVPTASAGLPATVGQADIGTILHAVLTDIPRGLQAMVPRTMPLTDNSGLSAGAVVTGQNGTVSGNNIIFTPDANNIIDIFFGVTQADATKTLTLRPPITLTGTPSLVPSNIQITMGFANSQFPQNIFTPDSPLINLIPTFTPLDTGVSFPPLFPYLLAASIVPCTNSGNTLTSTGSPLPVFGSYLPSVIPNQPKIHADAEAPRATDPASQTLIAPRIFNVELVSSMLATPGVTVTKDASATWLNVNLSGTTTPVTAFLSVNSAPVGTYSTTLQFKSPSIPGITSVPVSYVVKESPWFTRFGFAHAASYVNGVVAPGEPFVLFGGDGFGPTTIAGPALGADGRAVSTLGNTQILFDDVATPLYYSVNANGIGQVAGFAPFGLASKTQTNVRVVYNGVSSPPVSLFVLDAVPGLFTADTSGGGQGAFLNQNLSVNGPGNPELPGNVIVLYGGGAGQTVPAGRDGAFNGVGAPLPKFTLPVKVFIDGIPATDIPYAGPAPGLIEGVFQINVRIPAGARHNANVPVIVQIEDKQTQPGVTIATK